MRLVSILSIAFIVLSCDKKSDNDSAQGRDELQISQTSKIVVDSIPTVIDVDLGNRKSGLNTSNVISSDRKIIKLETTDDCLIGEIAKVIIKRDKIFVFDRKIAKGLFCFELNGKFLFKVGRLGSGPGEMDGPRDFDVTDENIYIIDRQCRLFIFKLSGEYQSTFRLPFLTTQFSVLNDSSIFYYTGSITDNFKYYLTEVKGTYVTSFSFPIQSDIVGGYDIPQAFHKHDNEILFVKFLCDTIFTISNNKIIPSYVVNFPGKYPNSIFGNKKELENVYSNPNMYGKLFNMHMSETSRDLFFLSSYKGINCHFVSKTNGRHIFTNDINEDFLLGGLTMFPVGSHENYFIFPITIGLMKQGYDKVLEDFRKNGLEKEFLAKYSEITTLYDKSDKEDNPALLLAGINPAIYED